MGLFKTVLSTVLRGDTVPIKNYERNKNFLLACNELKENYGYEIIYISKYTKPIKVGKLEHLDSLNNIDLEVCLEANYKAIVINNHYLPQSPLDKLIMDKIISFEFAKKYLIAKLDPMRIDGYGQRVSNSFEFLRWIETERRYLEERQKESEEDFSSIAKHIKEKSIPYLQGLFTSSDERDFK